MTMTVADRYIKNESDREAVRIGCYVDEQRAYKTYRFLENYIRNTKDDWAGKPFRPMSWQWRDIIFPLEAWRMPDGTRRFREVKVAIPKKNGKSTLIAALALNECRRGPYGGHICLTAGEKEQAKIIFNEAVSMLRLMPRKMRKQYKVRESYNYIKCPHRDSIIVPLSADAPKREGINPSVIIMDELHTQPDRRLWNSLRYASAARKEFLRIWLSTAGEYDETALWWEEFELARKVMRGDVVDISVLAAVYEAGKEDDWTDEATWKKANPSYGVTLSERNFKEDCESAKRNPSEESIFKRYRINVATPASAEWMNNAAWDNCKFQFEWDSFKSLLRTSRVYAGLDLSLSQDFTAFTVLVVDPSTDLHYFYPYYWLPLAVLERMKNDKVNHERYRVWHERGHLKFTTRLPVVDYDEVITDIGAIVARWGIGEICIDKWNESRVAHTLRDDLKAKGVRCGISTISAGTMNMAKATKEFERITLAGHMRHPDHPILNWNFGNCRVVLDNLGNRFVSKKISTGKIDGLYSGLVALAVDIDEQVKQVKKKSRYENEANIPGVVQYKPRSG